MSHFYKDKNQEEEMKEDNEIEKGRNVFTIAEQQKINENLLAIAQELGRTEIENYDFLGMTFCEYERTVMKPVSEKFTKVTNIHTEEDYDFFIDQTFRLKDKKEAKIERESEKKKLSLGIDVFNEEIKKIPEDIIEEHKMFFTTIKELQRENEKKKVKKKREFEDIKIIRTPIEFLNKVESLYDPSDFVEEAKYPLETYKDENIIDIDILSHESYGSILDEIDGEATVITMDHLGEKLLIGTRKGFIYCFEVNPSKKHVLKEVFKPSGSDFFVTAIASSDEFVLAGYSNGFVILWKEGKENSKEKMIDRKEKLFENSIVSLKIYKKKGNNIKALVSDFLGKICIIKYNTFFVNTSKVVEIIIDESYLTEAKTCFYLLDSFVVNILPMATERDSVDRTMNLRNSNVSFVNVETRKSLRDSIRDAFKEKGKKQKKTGRIFVIGNREKIFIFTSSIKENKVPAKPLYEIERLTMSNTVAQDIAIGQGYVPFCLTNQLDEIKRINNIENNFDTILLSDMMAQVQLNILLLSWGNIIVMYIPFVNDPDEGIKIIKYAKYVHDKAIFKIGFITKSFFFILDEAMNVKIISTYNLELWSDSNDILTGLNEIFVLEEYNLTKANVSYQVCFEESSKVSSKELYIGTIKPFTRGIGVLGKKDIWILRTLGYEDCSRKMEMNSQWEKLLCFNTFLLIEKPPRFWLFSDIKDWIADKDSQSLRVLAKYITVICLLGQQKNQKSQLENIVKMIIEYSIKTNLYKYLFEQFYSSIKGIEEFNKVFVKCLEEFILNDAFKFYNNMPFEVIEDLIEYYCPNESPELPLEVVSKNRQTLSKLLLHLSNESLEGGTIVPLILKNNLINPYIYILMNSSRNAIKFLTPIVFMESQFKNLPELGEEYNKFIELQDESKMDNKIYSSKEYYGHRILSYCSYCLDGNIYPDKTQMDEISHYKITLQIFLWLTSKRVLKPLLHFDSFSFFEVFTLFFVRSDLLETINGKNRKKSLADKAVSELEPFVEWDDCQKEMTVKKVLDRVIELCEENEIDNFYMKKDLYEFVVKLCPMKIIDISDDLLYRACHFLLKFEVEKNNHVDRFYCHSEKDTDHMIRQNEIEDSILSIINRIKDNLSGDPQLIQNLLDSVEDSGYYRVKIELFSTKDYKKCFIAYLEWNLNASNGISENEKLKRVSDFFVWLNDTIIALSEKESQKQTYNEFLKLVASEAQRLSEISLPKFLDIIKNYLEEYCEEIVENIKDINMQISIIEQYLQFLKREDQRELLDNLSSTPSKINEENLMKFSKNNLYKNYDEEDESTEIDDQINFTKLDYLYLLLIKAKCKAHQKDDAIKLIKEKPNLCNQNLLNIFQKEREYECAMFACKLLGLFEQGVEIATDAIKKNNELLSFILTKKGRKQYNDAIFSDYLKKMGNYIESGIELCVELSQRNGISVANNYWVDLACQLFIDKYYFYENFMDEAKEQDQVNDPMRREKRPLVYDQMNFLVRKIYEGMASFISIPEVTESIREKFKEKTNVQFNVEEFRPLLKSKAFYESSMYTLLQKAKDILSRTVGYLFKRYMKVAQRGEIIDVTTCMFCYRSFYDLTEGGRDEIIYFDCKHGYHKYCCTKEGDNYVCFICRHLELNLCLEIGIQLTVPPKLSDEEYYKEIEENKEESSENLAKARRRLDKKKNLHNRCKKYIECSKRIDELDFC